PLAVLQHPVVFEWSAPKPTPVLKAPPGLKFPATSPTKVFAAELQQSWMKGNPPRLITPAVAPVVAGRSRFPLLMDRSPAPMVCVPAKLLGAVVTAYEPAA